MDLSSLETSLAAVVARSAEESPEDTILGFIEVDESTQKQILDALRIGCLAGTIGGMLKQYPCLTTYGLSVAAPIGMMDEAVFSGGFYNAWESAFSYKPENGFRERLANAFNRAVDGLGLPIGTITPEWAAHLKGGCYLFHSGILPHYVQPLKVALERALKRRPLPDPEDDAQCENFARLLAELVHPAQVRLRKTLLCPVGAFLARRLVRWHLTGDDSLFPAHIQGLLAEQKGKTVYAQSPYLSFNEGAGEIQLVLPAQSEKLAGPETRWTVPGLSPMRAMSARPAIPLSELETTGDSFPVTLSHLKDGFEAIDYIVRAGTSESMPFLVFEVKRNRELKVSHSGDRVGLRPGEAFLILLGPSVRVASSHMEEVCGKARVVRYEAAPADEPLLLEANGKSWQLRPAIKPGLYLSRDEACQLTFHSATEDRPITVSYGTGFNLTCFVPFETHAESVEFSTSLGAQFTKRLDLPSGVVHGNLNYFDLTAQLMTWIRSLPDAIIRVEVAVYLANRTLITHWIFWKGLDRISIYGDIRWDTPPRNLAQHPGFKSTPGGLDRESRHGGQSELVIRGLGKFETERWIVPSNRVEVTLVDDSGATQPVDARESLELVSSDRRVIQFRSGGLMPIVLRANGKRIGMISPNQPVICRYPEALIAELGKAATVFAETVLPVPGEPSWPVVSWQAPLTAKQVHTPEASPIEMTWLVRKIHTSGLEGLRVRLRRVDKGFLGTEDELSVELSIPDDEETESATVPVPGITLSLLRKKKGLDLEVKFDRQTQSGTVWSVEVDGKTDDSSPWQVLVVPEGHGRLARVRFLMVGSAPPEDSALRDLFWTNVTGDLPADSPVLRMTTAEVLRAVAETSKLLAWKYPTSVWHQNAGRLKALSSRVSAAAADSGSKGRGAWWAWAIESLSRHSREHQPVVIPELPILHGFRIAAETLSGCDVPEIPLEGVVARSFAETIRFESIVGPGCLDYVTAACQTRRVDLGLLQRFEGFNSLINQKNVPLGPLQFRDWIDDLYNSCKSRGLELDDEESPLLSPSHFVRSLTKARRRCLVLNSVSSAEEGHWLSGPISRLNLHLDEIEASINALLRTTLRGAPVDLFWKPFAETSLSSEAGDAGPLLRALMPGTLLLALALRQHAVGKIDRVTLAHHLRKIVGGESKGKVFHDQAGLLIATAPELFAFYFLLFTLTS